MDGSPRWLIWMWVSSLTFFIIIYPFLCQVTTRMLGQGSISVPGCIAATPIECPVEPDEGYPLEMPLVYFFGHATPTDNPELYKFLVDRLSSILLRRAESNPKAAASGLIINTLGWIEGLGYELQVHSILSLKANAVFVLEQDRLFNQVTNEFKVRVEDAC